MHKSLHKRNKTPRRKFTYAEQLFRLFVINRQLGIYILWPDLDVLSDNIAEMSVKVTK
jgi:hypothetical protein